MPRKYPELTFTPSVKTVQQQYGVREQGARLESMDWEDNRLSDREIEFISKRDGFYVASVSETGWPYVQFRGGPKGFLKILNHTTLGFADFRGNRQYITTGNLKHDDRVALFLMDYANRQRLKIMAYAEISHTEDQPELLQLLQDGDYKATIERLVTYRIAAFDWNCPQHITQRWTEEEFAVQIGHP
ncbi:MAG: pyridoxamine 5'-phosphate oxidase family protein [Pirellulales bacterium]|nr:pyridoxamine 5'-phosphate oxidase family protein [Pirellulales bacterium]